MRGRRATSRRSSNSSSTRSEEHTSELQSRPHLVCRLLLEKKKSPNSSMAFTILYVISPTNVAISPLPRGSYDQYQLRPISAIVQRSFTHRVTLERRDDVRT